MNPLRTLPRAGTWEIDLVEATGVEVFGVDLAGLLFVVDGADGTVRFGGPLKSVGEITEAVTRAASSPIAPLLPGRPRRIRCREAMRFRLRPAAALLGAKLDVQRRLPLVDEVADTLIAAMSSHLAGGPTAQGLVTWEPLLVDVEQKVGLFNGQLDGGVQPTLGLKMAKRAALRLSHLLRCVDGISLDEEGGQTQIIAWAGPDVIGVITRIPTTASDWAVWRAEGRGALAISAGGAKRGCFRGQDIIDVFPVAFLGSGDPAPARRAGLFNPADLDDVDWDAPPGTWPKASTVLLAVAQPLHLEEMPLDALSKAAEFAATVWSAVVMADHGGNPGLLRDARRRLRSEPTAAAMFELVVQRKRTMFPRDSRIMMVDACTRTGGQVDLRVSWRPV